MNLVAHPRAWLALFLVCFSAPWASASPLNMLTAEESAAGWRLLWDGKTTEGWRSAKAPDFPSKGWRMQDGVLTVLPAKGEESGGGGDIVTVETFGAFELVLDFKLTPGANSGVKYYVDPGLNRGKGSAIGLEFQLLDDDRHPDAKRGRDGNRTVGSLYDLIPAAADKRPHPIGAWNTARIVSDGKKIEHWLNGRRVVSYDRSTPEFRELVAQSKYKVWPNFGQLPAGPILLQDHGNEVHFRNIKIRRLD